jgi:hypothetical protein
MKHVIKCLTHVLEVSPYLHCKYVMFDIAYIFDLETVRFSGWCGHVFVFVYKLHCVS